jgi:hypothetical protein
MERYLFIRVPERQQIFLPIEGKIIIESSINPCHMRFYMQHGCGLGVVNVIRTFCLSEPLISPLCQREASVEVS